MTIALETSALVAILANEPHASQLAERLEASRETIVGAHVLVEGAMVLAGRLGVAPHDALASIEQTLDRSRTTIVPITHDIARGAVQAFARYGKGRGHPAQLNFGDCLSYATAKAHGAAMLLKGEDFAATDIARA